MTSIYALSLLLCFCLYAQTPAQGGLTKLVNCKQIDHGTSFELIAEFVADSKVDAMWRQAGKDLQGATLEQGVATVQVPKTTGEHYRPWVSLSLGVLPDHYVTVEWNMDGDGNRTFSTPLEFDMSTITPSTDLAYIPGSTITIHVAVNEKRGGGHLSFSYFDVDVTGKFVDPSTNNLVGSEAPPFITQSTTSVGNVSTTTLTVHSNDVIDGYFTAYVDGAAKNRDTSPIRWVAEYFVFSIHPENKGVSFNYGYIF